MRILGIEFGSYSVKAVELESRFRRLEVLDFHEVRLPLQNLDPTAAYKAAVAELLSRLPSLPEKVVTSLPPSQTTLRFLHLPVKQRKKVEKMFRFELEDSVPFRMDDSLIDYHISSVPDGSLVFVALAPERYVLSHIEWLKSIGIDPDWLTFEGMGLINSYFLQAQQVEEKTESSTLAVIDIGHLKTNVAIIHNGNLEMFRSLSWGSGFVTQAIATAIGIGVDEAEELKLKTLNLAQIDETSSELARDVNDAGFSAFQEFFADLNHVLMTYQNQSKRSVTQLKITGGASKTPGLTELLAKEFQIGVSLLGQISGLEIKGSAKDSLGEKYIEVLGRALVFTRKPPLLFNFRKGSCGKQTSLTEVTSLLGNTAIMRLFKYAAFTAFALFVHVNIAQYLAKKELRSARDELNKVFTETFRSVPAKVRNGLTTEPEELKKYLKKKNLDLGEKLKLVGQNRTTVLTLMRSVSESIPPTVRVDVNTLKFQEKKFQLEGVLYEGDLAVITASLQKLPFLKEVSLSKDGQRFTYQADWVVN